MILGLIGLFSLACPDTQPPTIIITQPTNNTTVSGNVEIIVTATDNVGVTKVEFYVDGSLEGTDNTATGDEYSYIWDASNEPAGSSHTIQARAYDAAGNVGESSVITIEIGEAGTEHCGNISVDETWFARDNPHIVTCDIDVKAILTIEPGVVVKFHVGTNIDVGFSDPGAIIANGTASSPITFTSNVSYPSPGDWDGINFGDKTMDAVTSLNNCLIEYAAGGSTDANIYCSEANPTITNCTIRHSSGYGVKSYQGGFTQFTGNTITQNGLYPVHIYGEFVRTLGPNNSMFGNTYDGILVVGDYIKTTGTWLDHGVPYIIEERSVSIGGAANPVITIAPNSTLKFYNGCIKVGDFGPGGLIADGSLGEITFTSNTTPPSPGDWYGIHIYDVTVTILNNCLIEYGGGSTNGNISCWNANPIITFCKINHSSHYGIYLWQSSPTMTGNTFTGNALGDVHVED